MISKWIALGCLIFFAATLLLGYIGAGWGVAGILISLAMLAAFEVASQLNEKDYTILEDRVAILESQVTSMKNIDRLRNEIQPRRKA